MAARCTGAGYCAGGSRDRAGELGRGRTARTGSFDWTVKDVFLPERRSMVHAGIPLDNQWSRWPGVTYALPTQCWVGPHHSAVITGIARAGIDALIALAVEKTPRGRTFRLCDNPQVQDAVGRADAILNAGRVYRNAMIAEIWNTIASGGRRRWSSGRGAAGSTYAADSAREAMDLVYRHGGSTSFKRESRLAECWRDLHVVGQTVTIAPECIRSAAGVSGAGYRAAAAVAGAPGSQRDWQNTGFLRRGECHLSSQTVARSWLT